MRHKTAFGLELSHGLSPVVLIINLFHGERRNDGSPDLGPRRWAAILMLGFGPFSLSANAGVRLKLSATFVARPMMCGLIEPIADVARVSRIDRGFLVELALAAERHRIFTMIAIVLDASSLVSNLAELLETLLETTALLPGSSRGSRLWVCWSWVHQVWRKDLETEQGKDPREGSPANK